MAVCSMEAERAWKECPKGPMPLCGEMEDGGHRPVLLGSSGIKE
jgi:hypothetical protein